jgi:peptidoglycan-associated lipoprotein
MRRFSLTVMLLGLWLQAACKPDYPKCDKDADCPGNKDNREWCVDGTCQQCRPGRTDCPEGKECKSGRCESLAGFCKKNEDCPTKLCVNNRCAGCQSDKQCGAGGRCDKGNCIAENRTRCKSNDDCAESEDCVGGFCVPAGPRQNAYAAGKPPCGLDTVYFDFNESVLSAEATSIIDKNADCVKRASRSVVLVGHTDPRGTEEYNLALSERRAQTVRERLQRIGVGQQGLSTLPRGEIDATGNDETGWSRDRKVEFHWR